MKSIRIRPLLWGSLLALWVGLWACAPALKTPAPAKPPGPLIRHLVVFGFKAALNPGQPPGVVQDALSGTTAPAEPVSDAATRGLTRTLFDLLAAEAKLELISPEQAEGVYASLVERDPQASLVRILAEMGRHFRADAVLVGHLLRWRERMGGAYSVNQPASVAFDLHLIRPQDGAQIWWGKFDKTQRSLAENLLDYRTFVKSGGRWLTATELAFLGLKRLIQEMPLEP